MRAIRYGAVGRDFTRFTGILHFIGESRLRAISVMAEMRTRNLQRRVVAP
jgi:hypothetical protein